MCAICGRVSIESADEFDYCILSSGDWTYVVTPLYVLAIVPLRRDTVPAFIRTLVVTQIMSYSVLQHPLHFVHYRF